MRHTSLSLLALALLAGPQGVPEAAAQPRAVAAPPLRPAACPEGRLSDGSCVNPRLAFAARQQGVCYTQVKLSYIVCPGVLPGLDTRYRYPFNVVTERQRELNVVFER
ncbi:hypothetical protein [Methylobacterium segetis]|uniref:hypothetical protein n=1 Tax=Methylobacterium segetis TaxID=2488750 RepID=UPI001046A56F|nr:hypothetical protein [Methylobacterium segetis]